MSAPSGSEIVLLRHQIRGVKVWATSSGASVALRRLAARDLESPP